MNYFLKCSVLLLIIAGLGSGLSYHCPDGLVEDWMETAETVTASVRRIFSRELNDSTIANDSLSNMEVYKLIATTLGIPVTSNGLDQFQEAISKITVAKLVACSGSKKKRVGVDDISELVASFTASVDAKNMSQVYSTYGELLCFHELSSNKGSAKSKRQEDPLEKFYDSLNGIQLPTIFGIINVTDLDSKPTLAFVVDDTGSMKEEIKSVQRLIHSFIKTERSEPHTYILTTFNDPDVGVPQEYPANNIYALEALGQAVNALRAHDGGDCSELGMTGILNALSLASLDSNVVVLTDASPKDVEKLDEVITKAIQLRNSIHFLLSRDSCGNFAPYLNVSKETYGVVVHQIDEFEAFVKFADKVGQFKTVRSDDGGMEKRQTSESCADIITSVFTKSIDVFFSSISTGSMITVTNPLGRVENVPLKGSTATYSKVPVAGTYKVCSSGTFEYSFSTPSNLDFFVEYVDTDISSASLPVPGTSINIIILSSRINDISLKELSLNLLSNDKIVSSNVIIRCGNLLAGLIIIPNVPFQYQLTGFDTKGNRFSKTKDFVLNSDIDVKMCDLTTAVSSVLPVPAVATISASPLPSSVPKYTNINTVVSATPISTASSKASSAITGTAKSSFYCPCHNGGRCISIVRFGRTRVQCRCPKGYSGSLCQSKFPSKKWTIAVHG